MGIKTPPLDRKEYFNMEEKQIKPHEKFLELLKIRRKNVKNNIYKRRIITIFSFVEIISFIFIYIFSYGLFKNNLPYYFDILVQFSYYAVIIIVLLLIRAQIVIWVGRTPKSKDFKKAFIEHNIYNSKKELPIVEDEIKSSNDCKDYVIENMGIGTEIFSNKSNNIEAIIDEKILYVINPPETSKKVLIKTQNWESFSKIKEIELKRDYFEDRQLIRIDNMVVIGRHRRGKNNIYKILAW